MTLCKMLRRGANFCGYVLPLVLIMSCSSSRSIFAKKEPFESVGVAMDIAGAADALFRRANMAFEGGRYEIHQSLYTHI